ncbi:MAG: aspartate/glutamate racemase family protein [Anaerolineales bacterium]|nr:aspartate/glutamate racemase family protein [Anaerolineales bacterium]
MKTIGLIGGMSWESTLEYYRAVNQAVKERLGGLHSAKCILYSVDFDEVAALQSRGDWAGAAAHLAEAGRSLERAGAELLVVCTNTMHKVAGEIQAGVRIPLLHIADAAGNAVRAAGFRTVGLIGTRFTMEEDFIAGRLREKFGLTVLIPEPGDRQILHDIIFQELCLGIIKPESRTRYVEIIGGLARRGAEGVILGCTEIELLVGGGDTPVPLFPTTRLHAIAAVDWALGEGPAAGV